jgi:hypothetical protein
MQLAETDDDPNLRRHASEHDLVPPIVANRLCGFVVLGSVRSSLINELDEKVFTT